LPKAASVGVTASSAVREERNRAAISVGRRQVVGKSVAQLVERRWRASGGYPNGVLVFDEDSLLREGDVGGAMFAAD
jgi:hypothetical protein